MLQLKYSLRETLHHNLATWLVPISQVSSFFLLKAVMMQATTITMTTIITSTGIVTPVPKKGSLLERSLTTGKHVGGYTQHNPNYSPII